MSLDEKMKPRQPQQKIADRVAETLNLWHDTPPIQPTKKAITKDRTGETYDEYGKDAERDISMITNIKPELVYLNALSKSLDVAEPCEARSAFMEMINRASRSKEGWWSGQTIEAMKAVRPEMELPEQRGRISRFADWMLRRK